MEMQVLVATVGGAKQDYSLLEKMNIQTNAIVCNQCDRNDFEGFSWKGHAIRWLSFKERGVGLNRNNALMRATGDICLFADDDMIYVDSYERIIREAFSKLPSADVIIFNLKEPVSIRPVIKKTQRVWYHNYLRYGTARIAVRLSSVKANGIYFNQCFGGGTEHCHGEDNLFLTDCLKCGLKVFAFPAYIAELTEERASSWNQGYDKKYLKDQGVLYRTISRRWWKILCAQDALRHKKMYGMGWHEAYKRMTDICLNCVW